VLEHCWGYEDESHAATHWMRPEARELIVEMSRLNKIIRSGVHILTGHGAGNALNLVRNVFVARLLGPDDFGVAITFALTISAFQMATDIGAGKFLIQNEHGNEPQVQATLQALGFFRGLILGGLLLVSGGMIANVFEIPEAAWAYQTLAIVPVIQGLSHLDVSRIQRNFEFKHVVNLSLISQLVSVIVAIWLSYVLADYRSMLWAIVAQVVVYTVGSHLVAERRYQIAWSMDTIQPAMKFGWPLILNGLLLFAGSQGDRLLVGSLLSIRDLANYGTAVLLTGALSTLMIRVVSTIALPLLAEVKSKPAQFSKRYGLVGLIVSLLTVMLSIVVIYVGPDLVRLIFGSKFDVPDQLLVFLGLSMALWILQIWPTIGALALGDSLSLMIVNIVRFSGILLATILVVRGGGMIAVASAIAMGEFVGACTAYFRFSRRVEFAGTNGMRILLATLVSLAFIVTIVVYMPELGIAARLLLIIANGAAAAAFLLIASGQWPVLVQILKLKEF